MGVAAGSRGSGTIAAGGRPVDPLRGRTRTIMETTLALFARPLSG